MSKASDKKDPKLVGDRTVNVFLSYKHQNLQPQEKHYIERSTVDMIKKLLTDAVNGADGCDGVHLIYDRNCDYDYSKIKDLYNIADIDIFLITEGVAESPWIMQEVQDMRKRKVPIIPVRLSGYEDNIGVVCNKHTVDAMPIELIGGSEPTEEDIARVSKVMSETVRGFDQEKRDKLNKAVEKQVQIENGELRFLGIPVDTINKVGKEYKDGLKEGALKEAKDLGKKTPGQIVGLIAKIIGVIAGGGVTIGVLLKTVLSSCS